MQGKLLLVCLLAFSGLSGCRSVWVHPDWEEGKYEADLTECARVVNLKACMAGKGWSTKFGWRTGARSRPL